MALRDPGAPRRNPLFAVDGPDSRTEAPPGADAPPDDGWDDWADDPIFGGSADPLLGAAGSAVGPLISALTEAGPEAAEHLVNAAHELTLAVKVVVDAFERTLAEQRAAFAAERASDLDPDLDLDLDLDLEVDLDLGSGIDADDAGFVGPTTPRVQNIDLE